MKFKDFILPKAIVTGLKAKTKEAAVREILTALQKAGAFSPDLFDVVFDAIMAREKVGTTGVGRGVAFPHAKCPGLDRVVGTVAVSEDGVEFASLDGEPVNLFFVVISPDGEDAERTKTMSFVTAKLKDPAFIRYMKQARNETHVLDVLDDSDAEEN